MKLIIAGGRDYKFTSSDFAFMDVVFVLYGVEEVFSGGCRGADACGESWARGLNIPVRRFPAEWKKHGKAAGPIRNRAMAQSADALVAFPGGRGTADMVEQARTYGLKIFRITKR